MKAATIQDVRSIQYELEIEIEAAADRVWQALVDETDAWWLPDFQMVDPASTVTFDLRAGGGLIEHKPDGGSLLWYTVQFCQPDDYIVYLVGHLAPDFGGPSTTHLKLQVIQAGEGRSVLPISDAHVGKLDESAANSLQDGWHQLFSQGLKTFVEESK